LLPFFDGEIKLYIFRNEQAGTFQFLNAILGRIDSHMGWAITLSNWYIASSLYILVISPSLRI